MTIINKRYKDIFEQYIHKGEPTPLSIGTLVVCAFCILLLIISTFTQLSISHPWFQYVSGEGFSSIIKNMTYNPQIPVMLFIIYLLGRNYSLFTFIIYLIVGFFVWPIFVFGNGLGFVGNYLFGYSLGFILAAFLIGYILNKNLGIKMRLLASLAGVLSIHVCGFIYCIILAIFGKLDFGLIGPIFKIITLSKILYDVLFATIIYLVAPYIKNIFWVCMKPKAENKKKLKYSRKRHQVVSDNVN
ncbi:MAG: biotin transporter BioY [Candidatus Gastranaerophilales bacterium]|nr:biotin transporter BioY [Candidatus Gastranaerophilales bacterium]